MAALSEKTYRDSASSVLTDIGGRNSGQICSDAQEIVVIVAAGEFFFHQPIVKCCFVHCFRYFVAERKE